MAYPLIESPLFNTFWVDGKLLDRNSEEVKVFFEPTEEMTYYETVRIYRGVLLFLEDHLARLSKSVQGVENFPVDLEYIEKSLVEYLTGLNVGEYNGNMRIILTKTHLIYHICEAHIPTKEVFANGIATNILKWERLDPNIKVFRGDYKQAVAEKFSLETPFGLPYEVLLENNEGKLTEGSKSNFFAIVDGIVYTPADDVILIGITRKYVLNALESAGLELKVDTFSLEELSSKEHDVALFVSSTPFDILPISSVNDVEFDSVTNKSLIRIQEMYRQNVEEYYLSHKVN